VKIQKNALNEINKMRNISTIVVKKPEVQRKLDLILNQVIYFTRQITLKRAMSH